MTRWTLAVCGLAAAAEAALLLSTADRANLAPLDLALLTLTVGAPAFLAVLAWRRRTHAARSQRLFRAAAIVAAFGVTLLSVNAYRYHTQPDYRADPGHTTLVLPVVQWLFVLAVWLRIVVEEKR